MDSKTINVSVYNTTLKAGQLRLLSLHPSADQSAEITCTVLQYSFSKATLPAYEALSYQWGEPHNEKIIIMNGCSVPIRKNLWDALSHLRHKTQQRVIWIDALCINQANVPEKDSQVQQMRKVYEAGTRVIIWLGLEGDDSTLALNHINLIWKDRTADEASDVELRALGHLYRRTYWTRMWIIQEICVAKDCFVQCGQASVTWDTFRFFSTNFCSGLGLHHTIAYTLQDERDRFKRQGGLDLMKLLESFADSRCEKIQDKVYAVAGLTRDIMALEIDYNKSLFDVFVDVMIEMGSLSPVHSDTDIRFAQFLHFLFEGQVEAAIPPSGDLSINFWTMFYDMGVIYDLGPTFDNNVTALPHPGHSQDLRNFLDKANDASALWAKLHPEITSDDIGYQLNQLLGTKKRTSIDKVVTPIHCEVSHGVRGNSKDMEWKSSLLVSNSKEGQKLEHFWAQPLECRKGHRGKKLEQLWTRLTSTSTAPKSHPPNSKIDNQRPNEIVAPRLFMDANGKIGIAPGNTQKWDTICRLRDSDVVLILRETENNYVFVGRAVFPKPSDQGEVSVGSVLRSEGPLARCFQFGLPNWKERNLCRSVIRVYMTGRTLALLSR